MGRVDINGPAAWRLRFGGYANKLARPAEACKARFYRKAPKTYILRVKCLRKVARPDLPRPAAEKVLEDPQLTAGRAEMVCRTRDALQLVPDFADEFAAPLGVFLALDALRWASVNDS